MTSSFDEYDFDFIAKNGIQDDDHLMIGISTPTYILTKSKLFWTSIRVKLNDPRNIFNSFALR